MIWFRIEAPHFVAAGECDRNGKVNHAAPIIGYMIDKGWTLTDVKKYCERKDWTLQIHQPKTVSFYK